MSDVYFAGPLFTAAEIAFNREVAGYLTSKGHRVFLPQESEENKRAVNGHSDDPASDIFHSDVAGLDSCDVVVACLDGPDPDSGTSWEIGYAYGLGKDIVCYRTDFRVHEGFDPVNLMLTESADFVLFLPNKNALEVALDINAALEALADDDAE
jgi:nucleoside 2-deoxyribosyltransferase